MRREVLEAAQAKLARINETDPEGGIPQLLPLLAAVGPVGRTVLDLGCGVGNGVNALLRRGFDAYGADIYEYWDKDADLYWEPSGNGPEVRSRLKVATLEPYRLPFPDNSFDHVISAQVLEHVDDRCAFFSEVARVLKPDGASVHVFPRRWSWREGHILVPIPILCKSNLYLKAMAALGLRSHRQKGLPWRTVYESNVEQMKISHYPKRSLILKEAREAGLDARYARSDYVKRSGRGWTRLYRKAGPFGGLVVLASNVILESMLVMKASGTRT